jgi:chitodextrinase
MLLTKIFVTALVLGLPIAQALGLTSSNASLTRSFDTNSATASAPITVTVVLSNADAAALRGFCFVEQIPLGLTVSTLGVSVNGQAVTNCTSESGLLADVYPGFTPYRWVLETPAAFSENDPVPPSAVAQVQYTLSSARAGSFTLPEFCWSGFYVAGTNACFGHSESNDVQVVRFVGLPPPDYPILTVSTNAICFNTTQGNSPAGQVFGITNAGGGTLNWTAAVNGAAPAWLSVSPTNGSGNATVTAVVSSANLAPGIYSNSFTVAAADATNSPQIVSATLTITATNPVPAQGLVCYWTFDEGTGTTAGDSSGGGNNGTLVNGPSWTAGMMNGALSFNGTNNAATTPAINLSGTRAVSVSLWVNRTYSKTGGHTLFETTANFNNATTGFGLFPDDSSTCSGGGMLAGVRGNAGYNLKCYGQPSSGVWHHLVAVFDKSQNAPNQVNLYVDGVLQTAQAQVYSSANTNTFGSDPLYVMSRGASQEFCAGVIDDFRVFNRALSLAEVQQIYALGTTPDTRAPSVPTNLTATAVSTSQVDLAWSPSTDNVGVAGYQVFRNGSQIAGPAGTAYADTNLTASTTYTYAVAAIDAAGNVSPASAPVQATTQAVPPPDTQPPMIALTAPTNRATVAGMVTISANATDNVAVLGVQFKVDGANLGPEATTLPYQAVWNSAAVTNGTHTLSATARDAASNSATASVTVTVSNTAPIQGLVCYWTFDEGSGKTARDSSGSGNNGTLVNNPTWTAGKINGALSFSGVKGNVTTPAINLSGTRAVTVSLWVNRTYSKSGGHTLFESTANFSSSTTGFGLFPDDSSTCSGGGMLVGLRGNAGNNLKCYAQPSSGVWHHLVAVFDKSQSPSNQVNLYVDGVLHTAKAQVNSSANTNNFGSNPLYLMSRGGKQQFCAGVIDDLRLYSRALSLTEVQQLHALGTVAKSQVLAVPMAFVTTPIIITPFVQTGHIAFTVVGESGRDCVIEASADLTNWTEVTTVVLLDGMASFSQPLSAGFQFYRAKVLP